MEKHFTEQDGLRIINEMIAQVNSNIQKGAANTMILSGYTVVSLSILNIILIEVLPNPQMSFWVWILMIPMSVIGYFTGRKKDKSAIVKTHIDKIVDKVWKAFVCSVAVLLIVIFGMRYICQSWIFTLLVTPGIMCLMALAQYVTATATRFRPFLWGAYLFWIGALLCMLLFLVWKDVRIQFVILAISMILGFIIPGHILNSKAKGNV